ncbi:hypothetical protein AB7M17_008211 [Bradyrhizobium sp. USDA 377]
MSPADDTAVMTLFRPGTAPHHTGCIASHRQLRNATNGYNVSFEKPVVVGHDYLMSFPLIDCAIDDCRNKR